MAMPSIKQIAEFTDTELKQLKKRVNKELNRRKRLSLVNDPIKSKPTGGRRRKFNIYVLLCKGGKYYVGMTAQKVASRFEQHASGKGAQWTKLHQPIGIEESYSIGFMSEAEATVYENEKTHQIIEKYGAENVRGGDLCFTDQKKHNRQIEKSMQKLLKIKTKASKQRAIDEIRSQEQIAKELNSKIY